MALSYRMRDSTSAHSAPSAQWKYDVFLSFRGEDTRKTFTDHLYDKLQRRGIRTFRDDPHLPRGTTIYPQLLSEIEQSNFAVVVLSPNYASSKWCLLELAEIVQCMGKRGTILPVFYEVEPSDVGHQRGSFEGAFTEIEGKFGDDLTKVQEWRSALKKVAKLAGWSSKDYRYETELIKEIVEMLWKEVYPAFALSESSKNPVGFDSKLMELDYLLDTEANDVCFLGIWGMGGMGKTTLARLVYQRISLNFEVDIFLTDVRKVNPKHLQEQLLCQILKENVEIRDVYDGMTKTKRCLINKKVLLVIDNVDRLDQLEKLAGDKDWFGPGSIIIITTRDQHLLDLHGIEKQHKIKGLNEYEALQLFSWNAFRKDKPEEGYWELSESILDYAKGLPLALEIWESFLYKRDRCGWESTVAKLKKAPIDQNLFEALRISYDGLDEMSQQVFLDVACFFKGDDKERVIKILDNVFGFDPHIMIDVLIEKSLITILDNRVNMHDLIQEMGREIVRLESERKPGKRSRLWLPDDIIRVFRQNAGTDTIRSMALCLPPKVETLPWNPNAFHFFFEKNPYAFQMMSELKFLKIQNLVLSKGPESLPDDLRVLEWSLYPSKSLPQDFQPGELFELTLHSSKIGRLWHGRKYLEKLTIIDLSYSESLTTSPDFSGIPNLERLVLKGCASLVEIHQSVVTLKRLKILNFKNCRSIENLPGELEMNSLEMIDLSGCPKVNIFPRFVSRLEKLSELSLGGTCDSVVSNHPLSPVLASWKQFCSLKILDLSNCKLSEGVIPDDIGCLSSLEDLDLSFNNFTSLPASISQLSKFKCLNLAACKELLELPDLPSFNGTCDLTVDNFISLKRFSNTPELSGLWKLCFNFINSSITMNLVSHCIIYSMLEKFLREPPTVLDMFSIVIPGDNIPWWFRNQSNGDSVTHAAPDCCPPCGNNWIGFALCVLVGWEENSGVVGEDDDLERHAHTISCSWKPSVFVPASFSYNLNQVVKSDHLCVFLLPPKHFRKKASLDPEFVEFFFQANAGLKVKSCGVRILYKKEVKELDFRMKDYNTYGWNVIRPMQGMPTIHEMFGAIIPVWGDRYDIPVWFRTRRNGNSVRHERPSTSCCNSDNRWVGFALYVLVGAEEISDELLHDDDDDNGEGLEAQLQGNKIWCGCWKSNVFSPAIHSFYLPDRVTNSEDHLCVFFIPEDKFPVLPNRVHFKFKTTCAESDAYLKVKGCGVRCVYEHDLVESRSRSFDDDDALEESERDRFAEQLIWSISNCGSPPGNTAHQTRASFEILHEDESSPNFPHNYRQNHSPFHYVSSSFSCSSTSSSGWTSAAATPLWLPRSYPR